MPPVEARLYDWPRLLMLLWGGAGPEVSRHLVGVRAQGLQLPVRLVVQTGGPSGKRLGAIQGAMLEEMQGLLQVEM